MKALTIGKVARLADVGVETVRFYQREDLIDAPPRRESGYRQYPDETVARIRFIKRAKELGFTLREIKELLSLRIDQGATCGDIRERAERKVADIEDRVRTLERMREALLRLIASCDGETAVSECPILESLEDGENGQGRTDLR